MTSKTNWNVMKPDQIKTSDCIKLNNKNEWNLSLMSWQKNSGIEVTKCTLKYAS